MQPNLAANSARSLQREDTRRRLLICARKLFRSSEVDAVSMEDIGNAAAVSRATVYLHFAGKPALLRALLEEDWESQRHLFDRLLRVDFADRESIKAWVIKVVSGMRMASDSFAIHRAALGQSPDLTIPHQQQCRKLAEIMCAAIGGGKAAACDKPSRVVAAELLVAALEHFAVASVVSWSEEDTALATDLVVDRIYQFAAA